MNTMLKTVVLLLCHLLPAVSFSAETLKIDPSHSYVMFAVKHFDFTTQTGKWFVTGNLILDKEKPENSKVRVDIPINKVVTGIDKLDKHLNASMFFNTKEFPAATFESIKVTQTGEDTARLDGNLTIRGVTKPVTIDVKLNRQGINPVSNKHTLGFTGTTKIKRSDYGVRAYIPGISDEVTLTMQIEAFRENTADAA